MYNQSEFDKLGLKITTSMIILWYEGWYSPFFFWNCNKV